MRIICFILWFFITADAIAQGGEAKLLRSYPIAAKDAAFDNLGNFYIVTSTDQLKKYNADGDSAAVYNSVVRNGTLHSMDVSNPLKPVLFYKDFAQVVILDRLLAQRAVIDLRRSGIMQPQAACLSYDNNIWVFDAATNTLNKIDENGAVLTQTPDLRNVFDGGLQPQQVIDHNNTIYLHDTAQGVYAFDYFGTFQRKLPVAGWQGLTIGKGYISGFAINAWYQYNTSTLMQTEQPLPQLIQQCSRWRSGPRRLIALCPDSVKIFDWKY